MPFGVDVTLAFARHFGLAAAAASVLSYFPSDIDSMLQNIRYTAVAVGAVFILCCGAAKLPTESWIQLGRSIEATLVGITALLHGILRELPRPGIAPCLMSFVLGLANGISLLVQIIFWCLADWPEKVRALLGPGQRAA